MHRSNKQYLLACLMVVLLSGCDNNDDSKQSSTTDCSSTDRCDIPTDSAMETDSVMTTDSSITTDICQGNDCTPSNGEQGLGEVCDSTNACQQGLQCLERYLGPDCDQGPFSSCTTECQEDSDCSALGNARCFEDCGGIMVCGLIATSNLPLGGVCNTTSQCSQGLECMDIFSGAMCESIGKTCSITCINDTECEALDPTGRCSSQCNSESLCALSSP